MFGSHDRLEKHLRETGRKAGAVVIDSQQTFTKKTSTSRGVDVVWKVKLEVRPTGEPEFEAEIKQYFRETTTPLPGAKLEALFDPGDHSKVVIDMEYLESIDPRPGELKKSDRAAYEKRFDPEAQQLRISALLPQGLSQTVALGADGQLKPYLGPDGRPAVPQPGEGTAEGIERLSGLLERGIITEGEFEFHKQLILAG
jgi:hypothetical protein